MREADWRKNKRCLVAFGTHVFLSLLLSALVHLLGQLRHFFREPAGVCLSKARHRLVHPLRRVIVWLIILRRAPGTLLHLVGGLGIRDVVAGGVRDLDGVRTRTRGARGGGGRGGQGAGDHSNASVRVRVRAPVPVQGASNRAKLIKAAFAGFTGSPPLLVPCTW